MLTRRTFLQRLAVTIAAARFSFLLPGKMEEVARPQKRYEVTYYGGVDLAEAKTASCSVVMFTDTDGMVLSLDRK